MATEDSSSVRLMQIKILYSLDNQPNVYLSRSENTLPVKVVQIPLGMNEDELITLGGLELQDCVKQVVRSAPDTFNLNFRDFEVYYQDISEQPDEPFVANGVISKLLHSNESCLVPGRVCQSLGAGSIFGKKSKMSSETLEIRMQLRTIEIPVSKEKTPAPEQQAHSQSHSHSRKHSLSHSHSSLAKRSNLQINIERKRNHESSSHYGSNYPAVKATRTLSLPSFVNPPVTTPRHKRDKVEERFKNAPFYLNLDKVTYTTNNRTQRRYQSPSTSSSSSSLLQPQRATRTRSMFTSNIPSISSPINEEPYSDDPDYNAHEDNLQNDDEVSSGGNSSVTSPYTPQQPPYKPPTPTQLPDDLDSIRSHTIQSSKLSDNHGLVCINECCRTTSSINWRYFETEYRPEYSKLLTAHKFDKRNYEGMLGPLCNACFLFYKNKGFMRPEHVVRKYIHQQRYTAKLRKKQKEDELNRTTLDAIAMKKFVSGTSVSLNAGSSPAASFPAPSHTPSAINQVIQNKALTSHGNNNNNFSYDPTPPGFTPDYSDLLHQINVYGGPSTDIDPLPGATPPMVATKSNTRVINVDVGDSEVEEYKKATKLNTRIIGVPVESNIDNVNDNDNDNNKENLPPKINKTTRNDYDAMINSFQENNNDWMCFFSSPKNHVTSPNSKTPVDNPNEIQNQGQNRKSPLKNVTQKTIVNMPSSPYQSTLDAPSEDDHDHEHEHEHENDQQQQNVLNDEISKMINMSPFKSSPNRANRLDTGNLIMSNQNKDDDKKNQASTPNTEFYSNDDDEGQHNEGHKNITKSGPSILEKENQSVSQH